MNHSTKEPLMLKTRTLFLYSRSSADRSNDTGDTTTITSTMTTTVNNINIVSIGAYAQKPRG